MTDEAARPIGRRFSIAHLVIALPWIAVVIDAWTVIGDNSFLWHVRAGSIQAESGTVLTADPFSFTRGGEPWLTQSWLAELLYARLEGWTGLGFVPLMLLIVTSLTFLGIGLLAYRASNNALATAVVLILTSVSLLGFLVPRPVVFSYLLFVVVILSWEQPSTRWTIPFLFWIWASVHGSFAIGLVYVGLRIVGKREWRSVGPAVAGGLATLLTAHGWGVMSMLLDFNAARPYLSLLTEWRLPDLLSPVFFPLFIGIAVILYGAVKDRVQGSHLWIIIPFFALALTATRSVPVAFLALTMPIAVSMAGVGVSLPKRFGVASAAVFGVVVLVLPFLVKGNGALNDERFPVAAADHLSDGRLFHDDVAGGYLIWDQGPDREVFIDDRAELYQEQLERFVDIRSGSEPWEPVFREYSIGQALLRDGEAMVGWLEEAGWSQTFRDESWVVMAAPG